MTKLRAAIKLQTAFDDYELSELLGEGGAGRVYGGVNSGSNPVAIKVLTNATTDNRRRFKNEIHFLQKNRHANVVEVTDHGVSTEAAAKGPFYVMPRFSGNLRNLMALGIAKEEVLRHFSQILDGVEAAHLKNVHHRDLKPENVLHRDKGTLLAIADFGIARFTEQELATFVETGPGQRLANFEYAAPEQRRKGATVTAAADMYALGLMLNEMFTGAVPHGTDYRTIEAVAPAYGYLDRIVAELIKQNPAERPSSIASLKTLIQKYDAEAVSQQRLSQLNATVIKVGEIDDPLAYNQIRVIGAEYEDGQLSLTLDRQVSSDWIDALHHMGNYSSVMGADPQQFVFRGDKAIVRVPHFSDPNSMQMIIDHFKAWMPSTTTQLKYRLENAARAQEQKRQQKLTAEREAEERRLKINQSLRV